MDECIIQEIVWRSTYYHVLCRLIRTWFTFTTYLVIPGISSSPLNIHSLFSFLFSPLLIISLSIQLYKRKNLSIYFNRIFIIFFSRYLDTMPILYSIFLFLTAIWLTLHTYDSPYRWTLSYLTSFGTI